jgi:hypothetical protein
MFQGRPGGGLDVLPEMLRAATIESRLKGSSVTESMRSLIDLAHMTKQYSPEAIKKLAPAFAFLSTANPSSLGIERAAGYAVPLLQSGLEIDPMQSLLLGTALTRAGATSTKSGTWLREMALRAMPGTTLMSKISFKKHEEALKELGLVDGSGKPTWFDDKGKPDIMKMLDIAGARGSAIPLERRAGLERQLFGAQGGGGFALLADPAVREQVQNLMREMNSPEFKNRYGGFVQAYQEGSTVQQARTAMAELNITMQELGKDILPSVNVALHGFKPTLEGIRNLLSGGDGKGAAVVGGHGRDRWRDRRFGGPRRRHSGRRRRWRRARRGSRLHAGRAGQKGETGGYLCEPDGKFSSTYAGQRSGKNRDAAAISFAKYRWPGRWRKPSAPRCQPCTGFRARRRRLTDGAILFR